MLCQRQVLPKVRSSRDENPLCWNNIGAPLSLSSNMLIKLKVWIFGQLGKWSPSKDSQRSWVMVSRRREGIPCGSHLRRYRAENMVPKCFHMNAFHRVPG